jgi:membrane-associated protein
MDWFTGDNLMTLIKTIGYLGIFGIVFAESGLFFGFFLPGDSLLFTAGLLASQGIFNIWWLLAIVFIGAVVGDSVGYAFGFKVGPRLFNREDSIWFHKKNIIRAQKFYEKYGVMTIILARFIPIIRTFAPIVAGVGKMKYRTFLTYNLVGGALWTLTMTLAGFWLVKIFPLIANYLEWVVAGIVIVSILPAIGEIIREKLKG